MEFALALAAAIMAAVSLVLHVVAPFTKTDKDDKFLEKVDAVKDLLPKK